MVMIGRRPWHLALPDRWPQGSYLGDGTVLNGPSTDGPRSEVRGAELPHGGPEIGSLHVLGGTFDVQLVEVVFDEP